MEAKVRFEEPGASAAPRRGATPPAENPVSMERDETDEPLDYNDDLGEAPFDPMNDELPFVATSWDSELDGPSIDITPSQENVLLSDDLLIAPVATDAENVTRMLGGLSPDVLDAVAKELAKLHAKATPTPPHPGSGQTIFKRVSGDLGPTITKKKND